MNLLELEKSFTQQKIDLTVSTSTTLSIIVIIISAITFLQSLPVLVQELFQFFNHGERISNYADTPLIIYHFIRAVASYLAMTNSATVVKWINKNSTKQDINES